MKPAPLVTLRDMDAARLDWATTEVSDDVVRLNRTIYIETPLGILLAPKNFESDFSSHPCKALGFEPPNRSRWPGLIHDLLYSYQLVEHNGVYRAVSKWQCDIAFRTLLIQLGMRKWRANLWFLILTFFGWAAWFGKECRRPYYDNLLINA